MPSNNINTIDTRDIVISRKQMKEMIKKASKLLGKFLNNLEKQKPIDSNEAAKLMSHMNTALKEQKFNEAIKTSKMIFGKFPMLLGYNQPALAEGLRKRKKSKRKVGGAGARSPDAAYSRVRNPKGPAFDLIISRKSSRRRSRSPPKRRSHQPPTPPSPRRSRSPRRSPSPRSPRRSRSMVAHSPAGTDLGIVSTISSLGRWIQRMCSEMPPSAQKGLFWVTIVALMIIFLNYVYMTTFGVPTPLTDEQLAQKNLWKEMAEATTQTALDFANAKLTALNSASRSQYDAGRRPGADRMADDLSAANTLSATAQAGLLEAQAGATTSPTSVVAYIAVSLAGLMLVYSGAVRESHSRTRTYTDVNKESDTMFSSWLNKKY